MFIERRSSRRSVALIISLLLSICALAAMNQASASAATSCSGTQIDSAPLKAGSKRAGTLYLYYNSTTKKNCAKATNTTPSRKTMGVEITRCYDGADPCSAMDERTSTTYDEGDYIDYAGPVNTPHSSAGLCIYTGAWLYDGSDFYSASIRGHCG
jgi:hypothetical protein